jgi:hypothetical protein
MKTQNSQKLFGLFSRRERWGLSLRGWLCLILATVAGGWFLFLNIQPFLAVTQRENTRILVVEGWAGENTMNAALIEFRAGHYEKIYTTGGPVAGLDANRDNFRTWADRGANLLVKTGLPAGLVQSVPSPLVTRDRTYGSALALREWFHRHHLAVQSLNVLTEDAHARRTRLLFQEAFGRETRVGVISVPDPAYDAKRWWHYSEGVRVVLSESIAYVYAKCLFHPEKPDNR